MNKTNEGPQTRTIPQQTETTCYGCKWLQSKLGRSGNWPLRNHHCTHPHSPVVILPATNNIAYMSDEDPKPPYWCPFLPENKKGDGCTKPNCNCAEMEMKKQGSDLIKSYPCLKGRSDIDEVKREFRPTSKKWIEPKENIA